MEHHGSRLLLIINIHLKVINYRSTACSVSTVSRRCFCLIRNGCHATFKTLRVATRDIVFKIIGHSRTAAQKTGVRLGVSAYARDRAAGARGVGSDDTSAWASDSKTLFYTQKDDETLRSKAIFRHVMGAEASGDVKVYEEMDETFGATVYLTKSKKYMVIGCFSTLTSEFRILLADDPEGEFKLVQPRERGLEYNISHYGDHFYIITNQLRVFSTFEAVTSIALLDEPAVD